MSSTKNDLRDLIWLQTAFIGDLVLTSGAIALAAKCFPGIRQLVITTPVGCEVLKGSPFLSERIPFAKRQNGLSAFQEVKKHLKKARVKPQSARILQVHRSMRSSLLSRYLGIETITYNETVLGILARQRVKREKNLHEVVRVASLLSALGVSDDDIHSVKPYFQSLPLRPEISWQKEISEFQGNIIALAVGSHWGTKRWPLEYYTELADRLCARPNTALVLLGSADEKILTDQLLTHLKSPQRLVWNLAGQTSFDDLRRVYPKLSLLVSNDSSSIHFASAFNVPTVAIFGPTVPSFGFGPLADKSRIVEHKDLLCRPCSPHGPQVCPLKHFRCMKELDVNQVYRAVCDLL